MRERLTPIRSATGARLRAAAFVACALARSGPAWAQPSAPAPLSSEAQAHFDRGIAAYGAKQYEEAIAELSAAYAIQPTRDVVFAWAQAERLSGDCPSAITLYRRFLANDPPSNEREHATEQLSRCERAIGTSPEPLGQPAPSPRAAPAPPPKPAAPPIPRERTSPWYTDVLGDILMVAGGAALGVGAGFFIAAAGSDSAARDAPTYPEFLARVDDAGTQRVVGTIGVAAGGTLCALGVIRFATRGGGAPRETRVGVGVERSAPMLNVLGSF